ncbi:DUF2278 family protein [Streptomyces sp. NBC_01017]|uniref:DUF2278 family protein n=1 Tax=Streptomyces sp. NBC_01017 TaxID=2903721 RepID=UPI003864D5AB
MEPCVRGESSPRNDLRESGLVIRAVVHGSCGRSSRTSAAARTRGELAPAPRPVPRSSPAPPSTSCPSSSPPSCSTRLEGLESGWTTLPPGPGGPNLDVVRGNLFDPPLMRKLPPHIEGPDNDLADLLDHSVRRAGLRLRVRHPSRPYRRRPRQPARPRPRGRDGDPPQRLARPGRPDRPAPPGPAGPAFRRAAGTARGRRLPHRPPERRRPTRQPWRRDQPPRHPAPPSPHLVGRLTGTPSPARPCPARATAARSRTRTPASSARR